MEYQQMQKQWWAPVWKGLVMDPEAKHYRAMKNAVWLYLYLLLNANRKTGLLMRKIETVQNGMGITRHTALRWFNVLRRGGYIQTVNTGRSLTIQVTRWKALPRVARTDIQRSQLSNVRYGNDPTPRQAPIRPIPLGIGGRAVTAKETMIKIKSNNEMPTTTAGLTHIGVSLQQELLAQELARELNDKASISLYRSYAVNYPDWLLRRLLAEVQALPPEQVTKGRGALFTYLVQHYAKGATENPGD